MTEVWRFLFGLYISGSLCSSPDVTYIQDWYAYWPQQDLARVYEMKFEDEQGLNLWHVFETTDTQRIVFVYNPTDLPHGSCAFEIP